MAENVTIHSCVQLDIIFTTNRETLIKIERMKTYASKNVYGQIDTPAPPSSAKSLPLETRPITSLRAPALPSLTLMLTSTF